MSEQIKKEDLTEIYDQMWRQINEDRNKIVDLYDSLKRQVNTAEDFAINGQTLSKFAEIMVKQTAQLIEIIKINQKEIKKENFDLDLEDKKDLFKQIGN